jgi:hypothetical protein
MSALNRKFFILPALAISALVLAAGFVSVSNAEGEEGYQPAGAWGWTITSSKGSAAALVTLHHKGTVSVSTASMFDTGADDGKLSAGHGVWERTGPKSFGGTTLYMHFNALGLVDGFTRASTALHFAGDPDHIEGVMYVEHTRCADLTRCAEPMDPDLAWAGGLVEVSGTRILRLEVPE